MAGRIFKALKNFSPTNFSVDQSKFITPVQNGVINPGIRSY